MRRLFHKALARPSIATLSLGVFAGLAVGLSVGVGFFAGRWSSDVAQHGVPLSLLPSLEAHASSLAQENFILATGPIEDGVDGVFFLDFLTGDLKGAVINERQRGFIAYYETNIAADFGGAPKNAKYLMVTGEARNLRQGRGQLGRTVLYIVEATSGTMVAYGVPWDRSRYSAGKLQGGKLIPLGGGPLRNQFVRDQ